MEEGIASLHQAPADGCYIHGLYLEGCGWDLSDRCLTESRPRELYTLMPIIWLIPEANRLKPKKGIYECPVYKTLSRSGNPTSIIVFIKSVEDFAS